MRESLIGESLRMKAMNVSCLCGVSPRLWKGNSCGGKVSTATTCLFSKINTFLVENRLVMLTIARRI